MKKVGNKIFAAAAIIVLVVVATAYIILSMGGNNPIFPIIEPGNPRYDYVGGGALYGMDYPKPTYNNITGDYRPKYYGMEDYQYEWIFGKLPEFKEDFFSIVELIYEGKITDYARVSENYWKQPEFYTSWAQLYNKTYINNDPNSWAPEGYGCFPLIKEGTATRGDTVEVNTYFKTSFGVEAYQGLIVRPYFPTEALNILGRPLFEQNPEEVSKYLSISILNPDDELYENFKDSISYTNVEPNDWFVVLDPTYQDIYDEYGNWIKFEGFPKDWVKLLRLEVDIAENTPPGDYVVGIEIETPCFEINQEYYFSLEHEYYGKRYNPGGSLYRTLVPHFQFILHVE